MTGLTALWLPILLSAVVVFVASSIIHMALPWHKSDYPAVPDEERFRSALRPLSIPPGDYFVPRPAESKDMRSPEYLAKVNEGPVVIMTVLPNAIKATVDGAIYALLTAGVFGWLWPR